jgi:hypothetical protein
MQHGIAYSHLEDGHIVCARRRNQTASTSGLRMWVGQPRRENEVGVYLNAVQTSTDIDEEHADSNYGFKSPLLNQSEPEPKEGRQ